MYHSDFGLFIGFRAYTTAALEKGATAWETKVAYGPLGNS